MQELDEQLDQVALMADVIEINDPRQLEAYRLAWNALLPQTPRASLLLTFDWLKTYWKHFGGDQQLRVMVVQCEGKPIGIVPLCVRTQRYHVGAVRVLTYPLSDWGTWYGPIGPNPAASLYMAMRHVQDTPRDWDMLELRWSDRESESNDPTRHALQAVGWKVEPSMYQQTSLIELAGFDWKSYRAQLGKKWRHELGRQQRGLLRDYDVQVERHRPQGAVEGDSDPRWDLYEHCLDIAEHSWQGESTTGNTLCHNQVRDFLRASHEVASRLGMVDMVVLKLDGHPTAFQYNYHYHGKLFGLRMGFDRDYAQHGVGKALMGWVLEDSFERGDHVIDMGVGDYAFKRRFRTAVESSWHYTYYPWDTLRGQSVRLSQWLKSRLSLGEPVAAK